MFFTEFLFEIRVNKFHWTAENVASHTKGKHILTTNYGLVVKATVFKGFDCKRGDWCRDN